MIPGRHQLPAMSPMSPGALAAGLRGCFAPAREHALRRLTEVIARDWDANTVALCESGTHALSLALQLAFHCRPPGRLVALPGYSCYDLVTAAVAADADIIFYDVDPGTLSPDSSSLAAAFAAGAGVAVVSPLYGLPVDWSGVTALAQSAGALVIEDAAQGFGARYRQTRLGALGDLSILSFARGKGWSGGRGGALLIRTPHAADVAERLLGELPRTNATGTWLRAAATWALGRPAIYGLPASVPWLSLGKTVYAPPSRPAAMDGAAAHILLATQDLATAEVEARRAHAKAYQLELPANYGRIDPVPGSEPSWLRYPVLASRGHAFMSMRAITRQGIAPGYPKVLAELEAAQTRTVNRPRLPGATELARKLVTLPTHSRVREHDRVRIRALLMNADVESLDGEVAQRFYGHRSGVPRPDSAGVRTAAEPKVLPELQ